MALLVIFGVLRRGTRRLGRLRGPDVPLDERDLASRHQAFRTAFWLFLAVVLVTLVCLPSALPDGSARVAGERLTGGSYLESDDVTTLIGWLFAWALFLPTAALAWREPDAPPLEDDDVRPVLGERGRDGLLLAALVAGAGLAVAAPDGDATVQSVVVPFLPFALLVCILGAVRGRRAGDGPLRAATRGWRIALALALVALLLSGLGVSTDGGSASESATTVSDTSGATVTSAATERRRNGVRCFEITGRGGAKLEDRAARREARRLGIDARDVCGD